MKRVFEFDDACAVEAGLFCLRRYNQAMWISVDDKNIDKTLAEQYFRAESGSEEEILIEKQIGAAAILSCCDNDGIPKKYKTKVANRMQREFLAAFRAAKVDFQYASGEFGMPTTVKAEKEREKRHKEIAIVSKTHYIDKITKSIRKRSVRLAEHIGVKKIIETIIEEDTKARWISRGLMCAYDLIPDKVKQPIKKTAQEVFEKTANVVSAGVKRFQNTRVGQKVTKVINEKVAPVVNKGIEVVSNVCSKAKETIKKGWTALKSIFA